jgi:hypothetical protein
MSDDKRPIINVAPETIEIAPAHGGRVMLRLDYQPEDVPAEIGRGRIWVRLTANEAREFARQLVAAADGMKT